MRRFPTLALAAILPFFGMASQVLWDAVKITPGTPNVALPMLEWHGEGKGGELFSLEICIVFSYDALSGWSFMSGGPGTFWGTLYQANSEDLVDLASVDKANPVVEYLGSRREPWPEISSVSGQNSCDFYLAFMLDGSESDLFGWLQLGVQNGELRLLHSAIDLDGGPMIVGGGAAPTPEPSSALLLLLGLGVLGLRKGRLAVGHEQLDFGLRTLDFGHESLVIGHWPLTQRTQSDTKTLRSSAASA